MTTLLIPPTSTLVGPLSPSSESSTASLMRSFLAGNVDEIGKRCLGAVFALNTGSNAPDLIVGAAFLKNVYAAYRFSPNPAVGLASLSNVANAMSGVIRPGSGSSGDGSVSGAGAVRGRGSVWIWVLGAAAVAVLCWL